MTAALEGVEWSVACPGRTLPPGKIRYPFYRRLGGPQGRPGRAENLVPTGIRTRTAQPVVSRYTDWATRPTLRRCNFKNIKLYVKWHFLLTLGNFIFLYSQLSSPKHRSENRHILSPHFVHHTFNTMIAGCTPVSYQNTKALYFYK